MLFVDWRMRYLDPRQKQVRQDLSNKNLYNFQHHPYSCNLMSNHRHLFLFPKILWCGKKLHSKNFIGTRILSAIRHKNDICHSWQAFVTKTSKILYRHCWQNNREFFNIFEIGEKYWSVSSKDAQKNLNLKTTLQ